MDLWKKAERNGAEDILLLRYEKGAKATRVIYPEKGAFKDTVYYDVYGPTIIATNEPLHKILDSRGINITMPNKPGNYENPTPEKVREIKERLTAWQARVQDTPLPSIEPIQGIQGRLWDISEPLLQVCKMVYPEGLDRLKDALLEVAGQRVEDKKASIEGKIVAILDELSPDGLSEWEIKTADVLTELNKERPELHILSPQYLGIKLKAMGLKTRITHGHSVIVVNGDSFGTLLDQFVSIKSPRAGKNSPHSPNSPIQEPSTVYGGRELGESDVNSPETHPKQTLDTVVMGEYGENGESLQEEEVIMSDGTRARTRNKSQSISM
jgi:nitrate reductase NapAB chaperone NapD